MCLIIIIQLKFNFKSVIKTNLCFFVFFFLSFFVSPLSSPFYLWPHELLHQIEIRDDTTNADEAVFKETDDLILMRHRVWCHCNAGWRKISWTVVWTSFFFEVLRHVRYYLFVLLWRHVFDHVFLAVFLLYDVTPLLIGTQLLMVQLPLRTVCELLWPFGSMNFNLPPCFSF